MQYRRYRDITSKPKGFKPWLFMTKNASVNTEAVRASAHALSDVNRTELSQLLDRLGE